MATLHQKYILYKNLDVWYGTGYSNYSARVMNKNLVTSFKDFNSLKDIINHLLEHTSLTFNDIFVACDAFVL